MEDKYIIEIYYPTGKDHLIAYFSSDTPFQAISKGDMVNSDSLPDANRAMDLRVSSIEHFIWNLETGESKHKVCVYTEAVDA